LDVVDLRIGGMVSELCRRRGGHGGGRRMCPKDEEELKYILERGEGW
jgi:hypothetical protein